MTIIFDGTAGITTPAEVANTSVTTPIVKSSSSLVFQTNGTNEAMRIDSSGNLQFANTSGTAIKWQNGYQTITGDAATDVLTYRTYTTHIWKNLTSAGSNTDGTERMRISSAGYIGANTNNPIAQLDVRSQINVTQISPYTASIQAVKASGFGYEQNAYRAVVFGPTSGNQSIALGFDPSTISGGSFGGGGNEIITKRQTSWIVPNSGATDWQTAFSWNGQAVTIPGSLSKGSGSFRIDHPLSALEETHQLVHSFIEGPQADLIYRGVVDLVNGTATVNIDTAAGMTEGTFEALCREVQCFTTNESDWTAVRGKVVGNILTIEAQENTATSTISWMVIGERKDKHMIDTEWTDENGKVIVEPLKTINETVADKEKNN